MHDAALIACASRLGQVERLLPLVKTRRQAATARDEASDLSWGWG